MSYDVGELVPCPYCEGDLKLDVSEEVRGRVLKWYQCKDCKKHTSSSDLHQYKIKRDAEIFRKHSTRGVF